MRDKNTAAFEAALIIVQELAFNGCELGQDNVRKIVGVDRIGATGQFGKGIVMSSGFTSILHGVVEFNVFCPFCADEFIDAHNLI